MRRCFVFLFGLLMISPASGLAVADVCAKPIVSIRDIQDEEILHPQLTGTLYQRAFLKLAQRLSLENLNTVESYAHTLSLRLTKEQTESFKAEYTRFAQAETYEAFLQIIKKADYWKSSLRLPNAYVALVAALARHMGEIHLNTAEIEALWISQNWPAQEGQSLTRQLAQLSGALDKRRHLTVAEYTVSLRALGKDCANITQETLQKKLREDFWLTLRNKQATRAVGTKVFLNQDVLADIPALRLPDQKLRLGEPRPVTLKTYTNEDFRTYINKRHDINRRDNLEVIRFFHTHYGDAPFAVVNKKAKLIQFFRVDGQELSRNAIETYPGDELNSGGAGIYHFTSQQDGFVFLQAERDLQIRAAFKTNASLSRDMIVYVLPETADHRFRIRNHRLTFGAAKVFRNRLAYNYSPMNREFKTVKIKVDIDDNFAKIYAQALQDEKTTLMGLLNIEDDEYNMLAEFAFGVMSPETNFGKNWKYRLKELAPVAIALLKGNGLDTDENSRGPTQIKRIPQVIIEKYKMEKSDLKDPKSAAIATLAFSADLLKDLRNVAWQHPDIIEENLQDYLYYLYQGRRWEIRDATATPDKNASIKKIKQAVLLMTIQNN
ncbi:hypothetical protein predicted by Glimmer/Critica [Bdellovibrio bacteriovorus HD100]|uniref:Uncharacterized protein n=2 Tax=Bdellovibrio bacteriovorus TaxID=959 RepID=Q6MNV1_BDEBA|nr:hypothetical protein predicted by Glimmer/Critica [Bdellovibrio bacteriovorus HD100]